MPTSNMSATIMSNASIASRDSSSSAPTRRASRHAAHAQNAAWAASRAKSSTAWECWPLTFCMATAANTRATTQEPSTSRIKLAARRRTRHAPEDTRSQCSSSSPLRKAIASMLAITAKQGVDATNTTTRRSASPCAGLALQITITKRAPSNMSSPPRKSSTDSQRHSRKSWALSTTR